MSNTKLQGKYLKTGFYDEGVAYAPFDRKTPIGVSTFTFDENGIFYHRDQTTYSKPEEKDKFLCHMKEVVKQTLLMNFTLDEIMELVGKQSSMSSVLTELRKLELEKVMDKLESVM